MRLMPLRRLALIVAGLLLASTTLPIPTSAGSGHDLEIDISPSETTVQPGTNVTFTMTIQNNGPTPAAQANVTTAAPAGTAFVSVSSSAGSVEDQPAAGETGSVAVNLGPMTVGQTETVTMVLTLVATPGTAVTVESEVQPLNPNGDPVQSNNRSEVDIEVVAPTMADLELDAFGDEDEAGTGSPFGYTLTVTNPEPGRSPRDAAVGIVVTTHTPEGTVFADISTSQGKFEVPEVGEPGLIVCSLGALEEGEEATIELTVNVFAEAGAELDFTASVSATSEDPNPDNNEAQVTTPVIDNGDATLSWEPPPAPTDAIPLPPPQRLEVDRSGAPAIVGNVARPHASLVGYNVYRSNSPGVAPSPGTFFMSVPPGQTNTSAPVAPGGSFFTVTGQYDKGESGPSNEGSADVPAADITKVKVKPAKIQATGVGFSDEVSVFVDGIPFVAAAAVKKQGTKVIQKGNLLTGQSIGAYLAANPSVLITFRNSNGGIASWRHPQ